MYAAKEGRTTRGTYVPPSSHTAIICKLWRISNRLAEFVHCFAAVSTLAECGPLKEGTKQTHAMQATAVGGFCVPCVRLNEGRKCGRVELIGSSGVVFLCPSRMCAGSNMYYIRLPNDMCCNLWRYDVPIIVYHDWHSLYKSDTFSNEKRPKRSE